jgi:hypothetical protein
MGKFTFLLCTHLILWLFPSVFPTRTFSQVSDLSSVYYMPRPCVLLYLTTLITLGECGGVGLSGDTLVSYSGGARFESRPGHPLTWQVFRRFPQSFQENSGIVPRLGHDRFLRNPLQINILLSIHSTLYSLDSESVVKNPQVNNYITSCEECSSTSCGLLCPPPSVIWAGLQSAELKYEIWYSISVISKQGKMEWVSKRWTHPKSWERFQGSVPFVLWSLALPFSSLLRGLQLGIDQHFVKFNKCSVRDSYGNQYCTKAELGWDETLVRGRVGEFSFTGTYWGCEVRTSSRLRFRPYRSESPIYILFVTRRRVWFSCEFLNAGLENSFQYCCKGHSEDY